MWYPLCGGKSTSYIQEVTSYCLNEQQIREYIQNQEKLESDQQGSLDLEETIS